MWPGAKFLKKRTGAAEAEAGATGQQRAAMPAEAKRQNARLVSLRGLCGIISFSNVKQLSAIAAAAEVFGLRSLC